MEITLLEGEAAIPHYGVHHTHAYMRPVSPVIVRVFAWRRGVALCACVRAYVSQLDCVFEVH